MLEYHAAFYKLKEDDGWYVVSVLDFPGVNTQGRNMREARANLREALQLILETNRRLAEATFRPGELRREQLRVAVAR